MKRKELILMFLLLLTFSQKVSAQAIHITGTVSKLMKEMKGTESGKMPLSVPVYVFDNKNEARRQAQLYNSQNTSFGSIVKIKSNDVVIPDYEGHFEADISVGGTLLLINEGALKMVDVTADKLNYDIVFALSKSDGILIQNVNVFGKRQGMNFKELPPVDDGENMRWTLNMNLPAWYTTKHSRLIFQPVVVNTVTGDTIQYLEPLVFEGDKYHSNQIKRKSFDFERNDSLHPYYINDNALTDGVFSFTWDATYPKPDSEKSYKWKSKVSLEDYTHVYFQDFKEGTNNVRKPWKMLDVSLSAKDIKLDRRFFETVRARLSEVPRDLQLTFVVGKDELTEDSVNQKTLDLLVQELRSFGNSLMNFSIQGTASPEGSQAMNIELARKRARKILNMVGSNIQSASLSIKEPKVYTWNDVADSLAERGQKYEADELRRYAKANDLAGIGRMMVSNPAIGQILQNQRLIKSSYTIRRNKVLEPQEVLWTYRNDPRYAEGGSEIFSNGDYYNLFSQITDTAELRKLTYRAYKENMARKTAKYSPFAAYLANRIAVELLQKDSVNLSILEPFIDMSSGLEVSRPVAFESSYMYTVNFREVVANQALMYLKARKMSQAAFLANKLPDTPEFHELKMLIDLETLFFKQNKTMEEEERAQTALKSVMGANSLNQAILSVELAPDLDLTYEALNPMVDSLPDNLAKKWYMKGIIAANNPDIESENDISTLIQEFGAELAVKMQTNETPKFLAYFQHCFDIDPTFYSKFYVTDANVPDDVRKRYPYEESKKELYREKFRYLVMKPKAAESSTEE